MCTIWENYLFKAQNEQSRVKQKPLFEMIKKEKPLHLQQPRHTHPSWLQMHQWQQRHTRLRMGKKERFIR